MSFTQTFGGKYFAANDGDKPVVGEARPDDRRGEPLGTVEKHTLGCSVWAYADFLRAIRLNSPNLHSN